MFAFTTHVSHENGLKGADFGRAGRTNTKLRDLSGHLVPFFKSNVCRTESEARLAAATLGLDPGLGVLHVDTPARDSLASDIMEPVRPSVDSYVLDWITRQPLKREWFFEQWDGNCRLMAPFAVRLSETSSIWRRAVAPIAEWVAKQFWSTTQKRTQSTHAPTHLTQAHRRVAKGGSSETTVRVAQPTENLCPGCGKKIRSDSSTCIRCAVPNATKNMLDAALIGCQTANGPKAQAKRAIKARKNALARHSWKESDQPTWLTSELFTGKIQPLLTTVSMSAIRPATGDLKLVCEQDSPRISPSSETLATAGRSGWSHQRI